MRKVFISHSVKDKEIAESFIDLILQNGLSVPISQIFCSSTDGTMIESGDDWRKAVMESIQSARVTILLISPFFKESEVCICEMGGAWVANGKVIPLIIDPVSYGTVGVIHKPLQIEKLLEEKSLDRLKDIIQRELEIDSHLIRSDRWTAKKKEFIIKIKGYLSTHLYPIPLDRMAFDSVTNEKNSLELTVQNLIQEKVELVSMVEKLKQLKDKTEVAKVISESSSDFEEFQERCEVITKIFKKNNPLINGIMFVCYSRKPIKIIPSINENALAEAVANGYLDGEDMTINWSANKWIRELKAALDKLSHFMEVDHGADFQDLYEDEFEAEFDITTKDFWEEVLKVSITFN
jgi:hypothetical protein